MENETSPVDEELQSLAHLVTRQHAIVLCCAHSVAELVEEVARNLGGLGFDVEVVCGAEARSALLGRNDRRDEPTIYVVCVQGTLKEQVLKPLRQALATHGGPNQHLFVAVLDLALPLAMVGQIRRFAEALERPAGKGGGINERRQWREHVGPNGPDRVPTRAYRAVEMLERTTGSHPSVDATTTTRTGPQAVIGSARPTKVGVTAKYRAVTGQLPTVSGETESVADASTSGRRRRKTHAPKVRVKPIAPARGRRARGTEPPIAGDVTTPQSAAPPASVDEDDPSAELRAPVPAADIDATMSASWGVDEVDTTMRSRAPEAIVPPPVPARTGDTVIAPPPTEERAPSRRGETVLYTEAGDQPVLLPLPPPDPPTPTTRGNTVIGQAPTRFRATPVAPVPREGKTMIGIAPPTSTTTDEADAATARGQTVVAPPPSSSPTVRGDTAVGPAPSAPIVFTPPSSPTARGETVVAPPPSSSPTARGETVVAPPPSSSPTARGETVVAPPPSSSPTARAPMVFAPPSSSPTARGETVVAPPRSSTAPPSTTTRGDTVFLPPSSSTTASGDATSSTPTARAETVVLPSTPRGDASSPTARGDTVVAPPPSEPSPAIARGNTVVPEPSSPGETVVPTPAEPKRSSTAVPTATEPNRGSTIVPETRARERAPSEPIATLDAPQRSRWPIALGILGVAAVGVLAWSMGWFGGGSKDATTKSAAIDASSKTDRTPPTDAKGATPPAKVEPATPPAKIEAAKIEPATPPSEPTTPPSEPTKIEPTTPPSEPTTPPSEPTTPPSEPAKVEPTPPPSEPAKVEPTTPPSEPTTPPSEPTTPPSEPTTPPIDPSTSAPAVDPGLVAAVASRRVRLTEHLYVATQRDEPTTYSDARAICRKLDIDGVTGWRLPYRRELTAADIAGWLRDEAYWSRTRPDDDRGSVFVIDTATGELTVQPKDQLASVTCVKKR